MTSTTEPHIIARRYLTELWSQGLLDTAEEIVAPHCQLNDPLSGVGIGPEAVKSAVRELRTSFPDLTFSLDAVIVEAGNQLALRWFAHGTHRAPLLGITATDRAFLISGLLLLRIDAGRLIAITACWEPARLLEQLGLLDASFDPAPCEPLPVPAPEAPAPSSSSLRFAAQLESDVDAGWA